MKTKFFMKFKDTKSEGWFLVGIVLLIPPVISMFLETPMTPISPYIYSWFGITCIFIGAFKKLGLNKKKWKILFSRKHYFRFLYMITQVFLIFYVIRIIKFVEIAPFHRFTVVIIILILFFLGIYLDDKI